jgi:GTP-binding protein HflX
VVDAANPRFEDQITQVERILEELELGAKPQLLVFNKADLLAEMKKGDMVGFLKVRQIARTRGGITVSARDRTSLAPLVAALQQRFWKDDDPAIPLPP